MGDDEPLSLSCPVCGGPLGSSDETRFGYMDVEETKYACLCGVEAWVRPSILDGHLFVAAFSSNRPIRVRGVK